MRGEPEPRLMVEQLSIDDYARIMAARSTDRVDVIVTTLGGEQTARAVRAGGGLVGIRSSATPPEGIPVEFVDWPFMLDDPSVDRHIDVVKDLSPTYAVAPDLDGDLGFTEVMNVADRLDRYATNVIVVPKVEPVSRVPARYVVGVPFRNEWDTDLGVNRYPDFTDRPVHILGGNMTEQLRLARRFQYDVVSVDSPNVLAWADGGRVWVARLGGGDSVRRLIVDEVLDRSFDRERAEEQIRESLLDVDGVPSEAEDDTLVQLLNRDAITDLPPERFLQVVGASPLEDERAAAATLTDAPTFERLLAGRFWRIKFSVMNLREAWNEGGVTATRPVAPGRGPPPPAPEGLHGAGREEVAERFREATEEVEVGRVETERGLETFED